MLSISGILLLSLKFEGPVFIDFGMGYILVLFSTLLWGLDNNLSKIVSKRIQETITIVMIKYLIGGLVLFIVSAMLYETIKIELSDVPYLLLLGIGGFGLSIYFF